MSTQVHANTISKQNFIGKKLRVVTSTNPSLIGKKGIIVDETKNTLRVQENNKNYTLIKDQVTLEICGTRIEGKDIVKEATDRIKVKK